MTIKFLIETNLNKVGTVNIPKYISICQKKNKKISAIILDFKSNFSSG